jgi:hypothetical protein
MLVKEKKAEEQPEAPTPIEVPSVDQNALATKELATAVENLAKKEPMLSELTPVLAAIVELQKTQQVILKKLSENVQTLDQIKKWKFSVQRNRMGTIETIHADGE